MNDRTVNIRAIQHYMYCPRRFALLEVNDDWAENAFVVKANIQHQHVHDGSHSYSDNKKIVRSDIAVYNDEPEYDIFGVTDCIEFVRSKDGTELEGHDGRFGVRIIEYKPKAPKNEPFNETDAIQVFAQKICTDYALKCDCEGYIYYSDVKKRIKLPLHEGYSEYDRELKELLAKMRDYRQRGVIPPIVKGQKCSGCSMKDICMPKLKNSN